MSIRSVKVFAPASISNLGSGFDVLGLALLRPGDLVTARRRPGKGLEFSLRSKKSGVPTTAKDNVAAHVASLMMKEFSPSFGIQMELEKKMPVGSGLGSSAASSVAAAVAVNALLPTPVPRRELLRFAVEGERKASGSPHADNVAPSLLGGVTLVRSYDPLDVVSIPIRNTLVWIVVHPHLVVKTREARSILPKQIPLRAAVRQWGNVGGLTVGLMKGDSELVGKCMEDVVVESVRAHLIPGFYKVKQAALHAGAAGCTISGSGPSLVAVAASMLSAKRIAASMVAAFQRYAGVDCDVFLSRVNVRGAHIMAKK